MKLRRRLHRLQRALGRDLGPDLETTVAEWRRFDDWLAALGLSAAAAQAQGLTGPAGLRLVSVALAVEADAELAAWEAARGIET